MPEKLLSNEEQKELITILRARFEKHMYRHRGIEWTKVQAKLEAHPEKCAILREMEKSEGEPDVVGYDASTDKYTFYDCAPESPSGRRSLCYDDVALASRKENKPKWSAIDMAMSMGVELLTEDDYQNLQKLGVYDLKTSSWVATPTEIRSLGGAIFCDRRYEHVFTYHNGAESYYAARGWRGKVRM
jgi:hypothetical protein